MLFKFNFLYNLLKWSDLNRSIEQKTPPHNLLVRLLPYVENYFWEIQPPMLATQFGSNWINKNEVVDIGEQSKNIYKDC